MGIRKETRLVWSAGPVGSEGMSTENTDGETKAQRQNLLGVAWKLVAGPDLKPTLYLFSATYSLLEQTI